jgi:hypothetical protein
MSAELCELRDDLRYVRRTLPLRESFRLDDRFAWAIVGSAVDVLAWITARGRLTIAPMRRGERGYLRVARIENDAIGRRLRMEAAMVDAVVGDGTNSAYPPSIVRKPKRVRVTPARDIITRNQIQAGGHRERLQNPAAGEEIDRFCRWLLTTELHVLLRSASRRDETLIAAGYRELPAQPTFADVYRAVRSAAAMELAR